MNKIEKKLNWLNIHCNHRFFITMTECETKFNIRDKQKELESTNLSKHLLNKELDRLTHLLDFGNLK